MSAPPNRVRRALVAALGVLAAAGGAVWSPPGAVAVEGMIPVSELAQLDLAARGFAIPAAEIYDPEGLSLVDGICKLGGCTGSFVSPEGLILTNHHCAFKAVQSASRPDRDLLAEGFLARNRAEELPAPGYTVRITESYRDVSQKVLDAVQEGMDPAARTRAIEKRMNEIVLAAEKKHPGKRAEVAEMFLGKTYVLFLYTYLKDVRLVYAPPRSVGNFGGEEDNWIWPRHTGDFSFMRAYVGPDGAPAECAPANVPYRPRRHLEVSAAGVAAGDLVFLFGYPGRTYRHRTSHFLAHEAELRMPRVVEWHEWQIRLLERLGAEDPAVALKLASRLRSLHNRAKNYRGKLHGIERLNLIERKRREEAALAAFIAADPDRRRAYGGLLDQHAAHYGTLGRRAPYELWLGELLTGPRILHVALQVYEAAVERQKPDVAREEAYTERNLPQTVKKLKLEIGSHVAAADSAILAEALRRGGEVPGAERIVPLAGRLGAGGRERAARLCSETIGGTRLAEPGFLDAALGRCPDGLACLEDPLLDLAAALYPYHREVEDEAERSKGILDRLHSRLLDVERVFLGADFVPDANGTLRLSWGRVEGYRPRDAVSYGPFTTLEGLLEKDRGEPPFLVPPRLAALAAARDFGPFASAELGSVPVDLLYSADTTGGSSGSPVCNARGELVGVNFDRAWEATINDFAWHRDYSRSIGVDIRYVLWITWKLGGAPHLVEEMGVELPAR